MGGDEGDPENQHVVNDKNDAGVDEDEPENQPVEGDENDDEIRVRMSLRISM